MPQFQYIEEVCADGDSKKENEVDSMSLDKELEELTQKKKNSKFARVDMVYIDSFVFSYLGNERNHDKPSSCREVYIPQD